MSANLNQKIYVAGHRGMVESAIVRNLQAKGFSNIVTRTHAELDLTNQASVKLFFEQEKPDQVYLAAASVFVMGLDKAIYDEHTQPMQSHINVGFGSDITIAELASEVAKAVGYQGAIVFDPTKPDGAPRK